MMNKKTLKLLFGLLSFCLCAFLSRSTAKASDVNEFEPNNSFSGAQVISSGDKISGDMVLYYSYDGVYTDADYDYYKFTAPKDGKLELTFGHKKNAEGKWEISEYIASDDEPVRIYWNFVYANSSESLSLPSIGLKAGETAYILINVNEFKGTYLAANPETKYTLKAKFTATGYYEKELNNTFESAPETAAGKTYNGNCSSIDDIDYYKFTAPVSGEIKFDFLHKYINRYEYFDAAIYKEQNGEKVFMAGKQICLAKEENIEIAKLSCKQGDVFYISVEPYDYSTISNIIGYEYGIVSNVTSKTSVKFDSLKNSSSKKLTLKWSKKSGVSGYEIKYVTGSSKKTVKVSGAGTTSKTLSSLKKGKTYKVYIRTYTKGTDGKIYYGPWSSAKSIKIKK